MRRATRMVAIAACLALVTACGNAATPSGEPPQGSTGPGTGTGAPSAGIAATTAPLLPTTATLADASAREAADVQAMREEVGFGTAVGADAQAVLDFMATANREFSAELFAELAAKFGLEQAARAVTTIALARFAAEDLRAPDLQSQATGYVALGGLLISKSDQPLTGTHDATETKKGTAGTSVVDQTNTVHLEVTLGQGSTELDVKLESSTKTTRDGVVTALLNGTGTSKVQINSCPDQSGHVTGNVELTVSELNSTGGATSTSDLSVKASFTLNVDAGAHLTAIQIDATTTGGGIGGGSSWTAGGTSSFGGGQPPTSTSSGATPEQAKRISDGAYYAYWAVSAIASEAERFWRSGKCVDMNTSVESKSVAPKENVTFSVAPRGAFDKQPIDAGVDVTFDGKESVDPKGSGQTPPVSITYTAGDKKDDKGTISLKQTSNRGIGSKSITFTVGEVDYRASSVQGVQYIYTGTKCKGLAGAWTLNLKVGTGTGTVTFTIPESLGTAPTKLDFKMSIAGTSNTFKLEGSVTPETNAEGVTTLILKLGSGTLTQKHKNGTVTLKYTDPTTDRIALEAGSFCGT